MRIRRFALYTASFFIGFVGLALVARLTAPTPPPWIGVKSQFKSSEKVYLSREGEVLQETRVNKAVRRLDWVPLSSVPSVTLRLILESEDRRFYSHFGIDLFAVGAAFIQNVLKKGPLRGASTISMQVVGLLENRKKKGVRRHVFEKINQMYEAVGLESLWSKNQILEYYINNIYFRGELQGLAAASRGLFKKEPYGLTESESALLAALIRAPRAQMDQVKRRACQLLKKSQEECQTQRLGEEVLLMSYAIGQQRNLSPHIQKFFKSSQAATEKTSLSYDLQEYVQGSLERQVLALKSQNLNDAAAVVLDNKTGEVLAYVGNVGKMSSTPFVDVAVSPRQAGSTLKPFIYAKALERRLITAASVIKDSPTDVAVATGLYKPYNFDRKFRDYVTVREALAGSLNIPAVKVLEQIEVPTAIEVFQDLGMTGLQRPDFYGPSLALGSVDVRLLELTNAYRTLANSGVWTPYVWTMTSGSSSSSSALLQGQSRRVFSEAAAFIVSDILSDVRSRALTFGLESVLNTGFWTAVKTGTSKDMRDNWCMGYSSEYTVGVWAGNPSGASMWNVSGVQGAAPAWYDIMTFLHKKVESRPPQSPESVVQKKVHFDYSKTSENEWFIKGTEPNDSEIVLVESGISRFLYPVDKMIVALDPDIPKKNQQLLISVDQPQKGQSIFIDKKYLGKAKAYSFWPPRAGKHTLQLQDRDGRLLDEVSFQVRGLKTRRQAGL